MNNIMENKTNYPWNGTPELCFSDYSFQFWNKMRNNKKSQLNLGYNAAIGYPLPEMDHARFAKELTKRSLFRQIANVHAAYNVGYTIHAKTCTDVAAWVGEGEAIPIYDGIDDFTRFTVEKHKLGCFTRLSEEFAMDAAFNITDYLIDRFARLFGGAENKAFILGTGNKEPVGILNGTGGAEVGLTAESADTVTYNELIGLFFSVKPEYRQNGVWLMNDETALALRSLVNACGIPLWNHVNDTILGRPVMIANDMPSMESGKKPIGFGDFSQYWVIDRNPIHIRTLTERFAKNGQIGYLGSEFLDGRLIHPDAIKVIQMKTEDADSE